jgi:BirA family biotin operon repressor/biotin-[acetyl-CoA-carboxylase] ligase
LFHTSGHTAFACQSYRLKGCMRNFRIEYVKETGSTNDLVLVRAENGEPDGLVIFADRQNAARGRQGRNWVTKPGIALSFTVLIRPTSEEIPCLTRFPSLASLALVQALELDYGITSQVKWPNDVLINGHKISGVLAEINWQGTQPDALALGMGINLYKGSAPAIEGLIYPASSLEEQSGLRPRRRQLLERILIHLNRLRKCIAEDQYIVLWNKHLAFLNEIALLRNEKGEMEPLRLLGLQNDAGLTVQDRAGNKRVLYSGEFSSPSVSSSVPGSSSVSS